MAVAVAVQQATVSGEAAAIENNIIYQNDNQSVATDDRDR